jgi:hypothetical protein
MPDETVIIIIIIIIPEPRENRQAEEAARIARGRSRL